MQNIVIAPDSFKESLTALEVAQAIEEGFSPYFPDATFTKIPMADGGEGTLQTLMDATLGEIKTVSATNPLGEKVEAAFGLLEEGKTAVIEMATASGLELIQRADRNPMTATSWGLGDLIRAALDEGVSEMILGIGGSATNDGGAGMIQSLGGQLMDKDGHPISPGGAGLKDLASIDLSAFDGRLKDVNVIVASDVDNPLTGPEGASFVYGPQKGATTDQVKALDEYLGHFAKIIQCDLDKDIEQTKGAGAAGGVGAALLAFMDAEMRVGGELIAERLDLEAHIKQADLVITGEGGMNHQTASGKTPIVVAKLAKKYDKPVLAIVGSLSEGFEAVYEQGIDAVFSIVPGATSLDVALQESYKNVVQTARNIAALLNI